MISVEKIQETLVPHYNPKKENVGWLNELESLDLRVKIANEEDPGWYIMYLNEEILIDPVSGDFIMDGNEFYLSPYQRERSRYNQSFDRILSNRKPRSTDKISFSSSGSNYRIYNSLANALDPHEEQG